MRSKLRAPVLQNLSNFVHKPTPAGSETAFASSPSKVRAYQLCKCVQCSRARNDMQPLAFGDWAWIAAVGLAWLAVVGFAIAIAVQS
jgi:hypothetical protein